MEISLIGSQIQKFRKQRDLTQRELGEAVGVSTQAVSQWENGGAPDVALLPAIADRLGVTVDALFGREGGQVQDMSDTFIQWLRSLPEKNRLSRIARLLWEAAIYGVSDPLFDAPWIAYPEKGEMETPGLFGHGKALLRTMVGTDSGYLLGVGSEDYSYFGVFPEPEEGYERYFLTDDEYRTLFAALAMPGAMEALRFFCRNRPSLYAAAAIAPRTGAPLAETEQALEALTQAHLLVKEQITLPDGPLDTYALSDFSGVVPLLTFARWAWQSQNGMNLVGNLMRERCFEKGAAGDEEN